MDDLADLSCASCRGGTPALAPEQRGELLRRLGGDWRVVDGHHLERRYDFDDFAGALAFVNRVGAVAEAEGHHPDIELAWGRVVLRIFTHTIDGLSEGDFVLAAKADRAHGARPGGAAPGG